MSRNKNRQFNQQLPKVDQMTQEDQAQGQEAAEQEAATQAQEEQTADQEVVEQEAEQAPAEEVTQQAPVKEQAPVVEKEATQAVKSEASQTTKSKERFTPVYKVELDLIGYAEAMDTKNAIVPEEGGRWQYSLFTSIKSVLNTADQVQFNKEWNTVLNFFHKNKHGVFNERNLFRFAEHWTGSASEYTTARRILYTLIQTADPQTRRAALASIKLDLVTEGLTEAQRVKLLNFYGV